VLHVLKRYREVVVGSVALALPLFVYFAHARHPGERNALDRAIVRASRPVERLVGWAVTGAAESWDRFVALRHADDRARELSSQLNRLSLDRIELLRLREENDRLRRLLAFAPQAAGPPALGARVVGIRLDPKGMQLFTIDRGGEDGLAPMMPVLATGGVVGRVHAVQPRTADVLLLTDRNSAIAVRVERSRARANVRGSGDPSTCRLDYALRADDILEGDELVTAGTDGVFPRGLPVGKVQGLKKGAQGLYQRAEVLPAVDVSKVEEVLVLLPAREEAAAARYGP
jgi:rod shape-determining protein MreC